VNFKAGHVTEFKLESSGEPEPYPYEKIFCRNCLAEIADKDDIIEIEGSAYHYKRNPAGIYFTLICFSKAAGVNIYGEYTYEYTWFQGYLWSIALCSGCGSHLGWHYSGNGFFFGLISQRIIGF
jgi:hypothetical protein